MFQVLGIFLIFFLKSVNYGGVVLNKRWEGGKTSLIWND